jgi:tetratricopeptide (TPR) repeat protein
VRAWLPLVREKGPLLALSAASCAVTFLAQARGGAVVAADRVGLPLRLANGAVSYVKYAALAAFPAGLSPYRPFPALGIPAWHVAGAALLLATATAWAWRGAARRPWVAVGWLWYLGTLMPVIGIVQVGGQAMADRYTYVPLVGLFVAAAWGIAEAVGDDPARRRALVAAAPAALVLFSVAARGQAALRSDDRALYGRAVEEAPGNWMAWNLLGLARGHGGDAAGALAAFRESVRLNPAFAEAWMNLGVALERTGSPAGAAAAYREALRLSPALEGARSRLGILSSPPPAEAVLP